MIKGRQTIEIGEICCSIGFEDGFFQNEFDAILSDYRRQGFCSERRPEMTITVKKTRPTPPGASSRNIFYHSLEYDSLYATLLFDIREFRGEIGFSIKDFDRYTPVRGIELIETFISTAYIFYFLLNERGTFIHSCGISDEGNGYIFAGAGGNGKSTIAKLSHPRTILCDEMVLLRTNRYGEKIVYGTPFSGESESINSGVPCNGIYFIEKSKVNEISPLSRMNGVAELMKEGITGGFISIESIQKIYPYSRFLTLLCELLKGVPCYQMKFKKDNSFWEVILGQRKQACEKK
jgi:hypothetical protein